MKTRSRGPVFYVLLFVLLVVLLRFAPVVIRALQLLVLGIRAFWLPILAILIAGAVYRIFQKRKRSVESVETSDEGRKLRDVTNSVEEKGKDNEHT